MDGSTPQHYTIADFLKWNDDNELLLNPSFQRGSVWQNSARSYLIDSILRGYPIPKILLRNQVDRNLRRQKRDVVDGQQRLRTIIDFANDKLTLGPKASEYTGKKYSDLENDEQDRFLNYKITCEQLINASDDDVLEVFARINSYAVTVNEAEKRNAQYDSDFAALVKQTALELSFIWRHGVLTERDRVRMLDQSVSAELYGFLQRGVIDGAERDITKLYEENKNVDAENLPTSQTIVELVHRACDPLVPFAGEPIVSRPHFLMLVAAQAYLEGKLPPGKLDFDRLPRVPIAKADITEQVENISVLNRALSEPEFGSTPQLIAFREARSSTQRMKSRQIRIEAFIWALTGHRSDY